MCSYVALYYVCIVSYTDDIGRVMSNVLSYVSVIKQRDNESIFYFRSEVQNSLSMNKPTFRSLGVDVLDASYRTLELLHIQPMLFSRYDGIVKSR